jgi:hypothetical protein
MSLGREADESMVSCLHHRPFDHASLVEGLMLFANGQRLQANGR